MQWNHVFFSWLKKIPMEADFFTTVHGLHCTQPLTAFNSCNTVETVVKLQVSIHPCLTTCNGVFSKIIRTLEFLTLCQLHLSLNLTLLSVLQFFQYYFSYSQPMEL